jgi:hypothetical protein
MSTRIQAHGFFRFRDHLKTTVMGGAPVSAFPTARIARLDGRAPSWFLDPADHSTDHMKSNLKLYHGHELLTLR